MTRIFILFGLVLALFAAGWVVCYAWPDGAYVSVALAVLFAVLSLASAAGMWKGNKKGYRLGRLLVLAPLALGGYMAHFSWNFQLLREPELIERIFAVLSPPGIFFLTLPVIWWLLMSLPKVRSNFK